MKEKIKEIKYWLDDFLRSGCALVSPQNRLVVILLLLLVGAVVNIYLMFSTIRNWDNPRDAESMDMKHIQAADIDTNNQVYFEKQENQYEYEEEEMEE